MGLEQLQPAKPAAPTETPPAETAASAGIIPSTACLTKKLEAAGRPFQVAIWVRRDDGSIELQVIRHKWPHDDFRRAIDLLTTESGKTYIREVARETA